MKKNNSRYLFLIAVLSIAIPVVVAYLFYGPKSGDPSPIDVSGLPKLHATLNSLTAVALIFGFYFIRQRRLTAHRNAMLTAFVLSSLFLISYVTYHYFGEKTSYGGEGVLKYIYFFILITHIVLAAVIVPLVLLSVFFALTEQFEKHRKIARWTFPIWLYVAVTGVVVYFMIAPYYQV